MNSKTHTDFLLVYADGRTQPLDYIPLMGEGDILLCREVTVTTTYGGWNVARRGATTAESVMEGMSS